MGSPISIYDVVRILGLDPRPGALVAPTSRQASFKCPMCQHRGYTLSINFQKDAFVCPKCKNKGGATNLYALVRFGEQYQRGTHRAAEIISSLRDEIDGKLAASAISHNYIPQELPSDIAPAEKLDRIYRALLSLPRLALSQCHRNNLRNRGLSDAFIDAAGFRTMPDNCEYTDKLSAKIKELASKLPYPVSYEQLALGGIIVKELNRLGLYDFKGVPGFYRLGKNWVLYTTPGIIIPTMDHQRHIVSLQIRKDKGELRYMTLSNKSLPEHVQTGISRAHVVGNFNFHEPAVLASTQFAVLLTEGPLKADVIVHLWKQYRDPTMRSMPDNIIVVAIQGINITSCLTPVMAWLKSINVQTIYNCLDMDRITNPNVRSGSAVLRKLLNKNGFRVLCLCWGWDTAAEKRKHLKYLATINAVPLPQNTGNPYISFALLCAALEEKGICHSAKGNYWPDCSKGLDDWLHLQQLQHEHHSAR